MMTEVEMKIEAKNAAKSSEIFGRPGPGNRIKFSIRFDLMPISKPDCWTEVRRPLCQVFESFSLVTSSS